MRRDGLIEFFRVVLDLAFIQLRQFTRPRHLRRFRPIAGLAQVHEPGRSGGEEGGRGGVAVNLPMMIDATAKRKAAAKVKAINFSIRLSRPAGNFRCLKPKQGFSPRQ